MTSFSCPYENRPTTGRRLSAQSPESRALLPDSVVGESPRRGCHSIRHIEAVALAEQRGAYGMQGKRAFSLAPQIGVPIAARVEHVNRAVSDHAKCRATVRRNDGGVLVDANAKLGSMLRHCAHEAPDAPALGKMLVDDE